MMEIKKLRKKDINKIKELSRRLHLNETGFDSLLRTDEKGLNAQFNYVKKEFLENKGALFVAIEHSKIIGYALGWIEKSKFRFEEVGNLYDLFVEENYRNQGIGGKLARAVLNWFRKQNVRYAHIWTYSLNSSTRLYKRLGFSEFFTGLRMKLK